ncbi:zf-4CXXC-R1 domain-containing protein [Favolaschia claudopus]|uniref:Zf-4CXXC-R1 domain-containing protein n=1 Tax=Favolaschia claudopus TaxID=2862362 RepID=A0AAW0E2B6_9AGAR
MQNPRLSSVYVQVPASPYTISRLSSSSTRKENEPWRSNLAMQDPTASSSLKRKLPYAEHPLQPYITVMAAMKKPKLTPEPPPAASGSVTYIYCHQCGKKRDKEDSAHCSHVETYSVAKDRPSKTRRCHTKYCRACLKNRYSEDLDAIKAHNATTSAQSSRIGEPYDYKCPRCRDLCNCSRCRKAKGLDPTGKFVNSTNVAADSNSKASMEGIIKLNDSKGKRAPRLKQKPTGPLPTLKWTKLRSHLSVEDAEARLHIREFVLRFFAKALPKVHLDELEQINGNGRSRYDEEDIIPWVSEGCLKSIILAFLSVLAEEETNDTIKKAIQMGSKEMRAPSVGLGKIWQILSSLRDALDASEPDDDDGAASEESDTIPSFPDPLPLPNAVANSRRTRSAGSFIVDTIQMIPVILGLIDAVMETPTIRGEIDKGAKESKDVARDVKDATRNANERWEKSKKETENINELQFKARRAAHKQLLQDIDGAGKVAMHRFNPRFSVLGTDRDGRTYYALSPSLSESDSALEFIASMVADTDDANGNSKARRKRRSKREEERSSLKEWSWFIAVWGTKPPLESGTLPFKPIASTDDDDDDEPDDETVDKWWAIWQPVEIRKLVSWITIKYHLNEVETSSTSSAASTPSADGSPPTAWEGGDIRMSPQSSRLELLTLVANLEDYALGLEFRVRAEEDTHTPPVDSDKGKGKAT